MAEEQKAIWLNYLALSSVIIALCATLSTFKGGGYSTRALLNQSQASDQWAFYQAKSMKSNLYETQKQEFELQMTALPANAPSAVRQAYQARIDDAAKRIDRYNQEKAEIEKTAKEFETARGQSLEHGQAFGMAVIFLQLSIVLSSIAALMKKKPLWYLGLATGAVGIVYFLNGFWLFM
ncbi:MAG TPA: DUF4337 domain-containing protein [Bacteroidota bacterium]|nr:DUF4337 domain-containing protein [Bacteroidota bacterium]